MRGLILQVVALQTLGGAIASVLLLPALLLPALMLLVGCSQQALLPQAPQLDPQDATVRLALNSGLRLAAVRVSTFDLLILNTNANRRDAGQTESKQTTAQSFPSARLRIYLAGDGTPWLGQKITAKPGPRNPVALRMLLQDPEPGWFIGRPCYHQRLQSDACNPALWTFERYGERVLQGLEQAIERLLSDKRYAKEQARVTLVGYSGGGTLAVLLGQRLGVVDEVITVAAPLDVNAWTAHHQYTPLLGSQNPADMPRRFNVRELHLQGNRDREVPPATTAAYFSHPGHKRAGVVERIITHNDSHRCCWNRRWPPEEVRVFSKLRRTEQ